MLRLLGLWALLVGVPCFGYELRRDASGAVVRWRDRVEFVIDSQLAERMNEPTAEAAVRKALQIVAQASPTIEISARAGAATNIGYDPQVAARNQSEIIVLDDWPYQESALAVTVLTLNGRTHEVIDADIAFNLEHHTFRALPEGPASGREDRDLVDDVQNTLTHELGHALGLMHNETDSLVVMYPSAAPGETHKRILAPDDRAGLGALYAEVFLSSGDPADAPREVGCAATSATPSAWSWAVAALVLGLRHLRRRGVLGLIALPGLALAEPPAQADPDLSRASAATLGEVLKTRSVWSQKNPGLLLTELEVGLRFCLKAPCAERVTFTVPGGTLGDLEQEVVDHPVPTAGSSVVVYPLQGRWRLFRLDANEDWRVLDRAARKAGLLPVGSILPRPGRLNPRLMPQPTVSRH
jgi:hypothetical protein